MLEKVNKIYTIQCMFLCKYCAICLFTAAENECKKLRIYRDCAKVTQEADIIVLSEKCLVGGGCNSISPTVL